MDDMLLILIYFKKKVGVKVVHNQIVSPKNIIYYFILYPQFELSRFKYFNKYVT